MFFIKKIFFFGLLLFFFNFSNAQIFSFKLGAKVGLSSSDLKVNDAVNYTSWKKAASGDPKLGFHLGGFARLTIFGIYLQPELLFTHTKGDIVQNNQSNLQKFNKLDMPIILGYKILFFRIGAGPLQV
ncbi:MAG: hypothetical protein B6I24_08630 [Bacteroidetes bacterium 4572_128]|nr:MAG: hypothetical protein B6I24_08630 [Bacteroidetes bacterium 4572_128]